MRKPGPTNWAYRNSTSRDFLTQVEAAATAAVAGATALRLARGGGGGGGGDASAVTTTPFGVGCVVRLFLFPVPLLLPPSSTGDTRSGPAPVWSSRCCSLMLTLPLK